MDKTRRERNGVYWAKWLSPLGEIVMGSDGESLVGLWFEGQKHFGSTLSPTALHDDKRPEFDTARRWLAEYFSGRQPAWMPPIRMTGTDFQQRVWRELLSIEWGTTVTYGQLAERIGSSPRAVGSAVGRNPLLLIVPCHRVNGASSLTGYAAGLEIKQALLSHERGGTNTLI